MCPGRGAARSIALQTRDHHRHRVYCDPGSAVHHSRFALALHRIRDTNEERLMPTERTEVLLFGPLKPTIVNGLESGFTVHKLAEAKDREALLAEISPRVRGIASTVSSMRSEEHTSELQSPM